jgi:hypothetical protein|nr:MAG TPA: hypothetical protein [Caudoviricetes sp.]
MSLLEAAVMTLAVMLLVLMGLLFVCLGYAVWMLAIPVWVRALLEVVVVFFGLFSTLVMSALVVDAVLR